MYEINEFSCTTPRARLVVILYAALDKTFFFELVELV